MYVAKVIQILLFYIIHLVNKILRYSNITQLLYHNIFMLISKIQKNHIVTGKHFYIFLKKSSNKLL